MNNFFDAFISYGRADSLNFATKLYERLTQEGLKVWFDQKDIPFGVDYQRQIDEYGIEKAHNFLFIIAPHSVNSTYCRKEIELAVKLKKRIIPLLHVEEISEETWKQRNPTGKTADGDDWEAYKAKGKHKSDQPNMHLTIRKINWLRFRDGIEDFEESFANLMGVIQKQADYVEQHTQFLLKALEWERHQKQTSYLLIGEEREKAESWLKIRFKDEQQPCLPTDLHCEYITESIKNANNLMTQVFLSHAEEDELVMEQIRNSLRRESFTVWTSKTDIQMGEAFQEAINRGIEEADNVVYLLSPESLKSKFCQQELEYALSLNKRIIPILVRETDFDQVPPALQLLQCIDLTDNVKEEDYLLDESQLLRILHQDATYYNEHKILLAKALKWQRQHCNPSILLRGYNLRHAEAWLKVAKQRRQHLPTPLQEEFIAESLRQPQGVPLDVFISYSRTDSDFARKLNDALQMQGKTTWFDQESIASGVDFQQEIYRGIECSDNFLFILSPASVNSPYCAGEVEYAAKLNKRFVTVLHRQVNSDSLHPELGKVQWIDFNQQEGDFFANFNQLVRTLDSDREHLRSHTKWSQRAIEWEEKGRSEDLLLRGNEFALAENWFKEAEQQKKQPAATALQKEYIAASREAILAALKKEKRQAVVSGSLGLVSTALVVSVGALVFAFSQWKRAEIAQIKSLGQYSLLLSDSNRQFDALIEAIRAGQNLKKQNVTQSLVLAALQKAVYGNGFREYNRLTGHSDGVNSVVFSPDGKMIASASDDKTIKLWSLEGKELQTLKGHSDGINSVVFSPDGKTIVSASDDKTIKLWSFEGEELQTFKGHSVGVNSVVFSPDGKTIASASWDSTVKLWSIEGKELSTLTGHVGSVKSVVFSPNGKTIASASRDKTLKLWSVESKPLHTLKGHTDGVFSVVFSPDGKTIASASSDETVKLWSVEGKLLHTFMGHTAPVFSVAFSPDDKTIASASPDETVKLWSVEGKLLHTLKGHTDWVNSVAFSPDGKTLASASKDKTIKLWSVEGKLLHTLKGHTDWVYSVAFSPDGKTLASVSADKTIKLWSVEGRLLHTLTEYTDWVNSVAFSPNGKTLASASSDKTIKLWSIEGELLHTFTGHTAQVFSVAFSPDGKMLASASEDKTVVLWSIEDKEHRTLMGHTNTVISVAFSPDGKMLASASSDKTVILWKLADLQLDKLMMSGCDWVRDYLKNNPEVEEGDRTLCDGIGKK